MTTLPNMGLVLPTRGAPGSGLWADTIDANAALEDAHNHTTGKGLPITSAALSIDADVSFASLWAPTNLHRIQFAAVTALTLTANNRSVFVNAADNELYWRTNAGANVKLTSGSALNVAAFTGGFGGDYASVSAAAAFDDSGDRYTFKQQSSLWARMASGEVRIFETGTTESVYVGLAAPAALAASYTITLPLAAPGSTSIMQMSSAGVVTADNAITPTTVTASGLVTASAGVTCAANQHVTVSGTGRHKHGTRTLSISGCAFVGSSASAAMGYGFGSATLTGSSQFYLTPISLPVGKRITAVRVFIVDNSTGPTKLRADFNRITSVGAVSTIGSSSVSAGDSSNQTLTVSALTTTIAASNAYSIIVSSTTGSALTAVYMAEVDYDEA